MFTFYASFEAQILHTGLSFLNTNISNKFLKSYLFYFEQRRTTMMNASKITTAGMVTYHNNNMVNVKHSDVPPL